MQNNRYRGLYEQLSDQEKIDRGARAAVLLNDPCFDEVLTDLCVSLHNGLDHMPTSDPDPIMQIVNQVRAVRNIRPKLESWVQQAKMAQMGEE